jgi:hypothetical protein
MVRLLFLMQTSDLDKLRKCTDVFWKQHGIVEEFLMTFVTVVLVRRCHFF